MSENSFSDPRLLWQAQTREHPSISAEAVRILAEAIQRKRRRNLAIAFVLGCLLLLLGAAFIANSVAYSAAKVTIAAIMVLTVVIGYQAYRQMWPARTLSPNAAVKGCLDFYRQELMAQHRSSAVTWRFIGPLAIFAFLTWNMMLGTPSLLPKILLSSALIATLVLRRREMRRFRNNLATLEEFEKEQ